MALNYELAMKLKLFILQIILLNIFVGSVNAQIIDVSDTDIHELTRQKDSIKAIEKKKKINETYNGNWSIGVGINIVDDAGKKFKGLDIDEDWNTSLPFSAKIEYFHDVFVSFELSASMNEYVAGKNIDNTGYIIEGFEASYLAFDFSTKLYSRDFFHTSRMDPYLFLGFGYTQIGAYKLEPFEDNIFRDDLDHITIDEDGNYDIPDIGRFTVNGGLGFNFWFSRWWAFNINMAYKIGIPSGEYVSGANSVSNQVQYSFGTLFLLN